MVPVSLNVEESDLDLNTVLNTLGYQPNQKDSVMGADVLMLPKDLESPESSFDDKSVSIKKHIEKQLRIEVLTKQGSKSHYEAQRAADILVPALVFLGLQAFDIGKGIIASWVYDRYLQLRNRGLTPTVAFKFVVIDKKKGIKKEVSYEGPADELQDTLKTLKLD